MRATARKLEREEAKLQQQKGDLKKLRDQMAKLRENCPHDKIEMGEGGVVICKDCHEEIAYAPDSSGEEAGDDTGETEGY